jgi:hypothetical protein
MVQMWACIFCVISLTLFFVVLLSRIDFSTFLPRYGRRHRIAGALYLVWLLIGISEHFLRLMFWQSMHSPILCYFFFDVILCVMGISLALTAALDFKGHDRVKNPTGVASGTLSDSATVSSAEMIEHSFYQFLNLAQAIFLHCSNNEQVAYKRVFLLACVTAPWLVRDSFFSPFFPFHLRSSTCYSFAHISQ